MFPPHFSPNARKSPWTSATSISALALTGMLVSIEAAALPSAPDRLAQQIVDGLPPPPAMPFPAQPDPTPAERQTSPQPALQPASRAAAEDRYLVYINGDSPLLLEQVRRIESNAFVQSYDGQQVIQAGLFREAASADRRVQAFAAQGIGAEVIAVSRDTISRDAASVNASTRSRVESPQADPQTVSLNRSPDLPSVDVDRAVQFGQPRPTVPYNTVPYNTDPSNSSDRLAAARSYYVVIPGSARNLPNISDLTSLLGGGLSVSENAIQERTSPLGTHVLVGPFVDRRAANRWNRYFRDFGLDARVYYGR